MSEADKLLDDAARTTEPKSVFHSIFSNKQYNLQEAVEKCDKAANLYKIAKAWDKAALAFVQQAGYQNGLKNPFEEAECYKNASTMYKKCNVQQAVAVIIKAIEVFASIGKFHQAMKAACECAEIYENELVDHLDQAIAMYEKAVDFAQMSGSKENKINVQMATLLARREQWPRAIELFEKTAEGMVDSGILKFSCKEYFMKAGLCTLASGDIVGAKIKIDRYKSIAAYFCDSRESKFVEALVNAIANEDADEYTSIVKEYDYIAKLDDWTTRILLKIKKSIAADDLL